MFVNSVFEPSVNYTISEDNLTVTKGDGGTWDAETVFSFVCLTSANVYPDKLGISCIVSSYTAATDGETNLPINNSMYNKTFDTLHVYHEKTRLFEDIHYSINADGKSIDLIGLTLNTGEIIYYEVFKALRIASDITDGTLIQDGSISELKLDRQLSDKVNNIMVDEVTGTRYQLKMINGTLTIQAL
jgi:formylmethanofuran dehydrogenase subunit C